MTASPRTPLSTNFLIFSLLCLSSVSSAWWIPSPSSSFLYTIDGGTVPTSASDSAAMIYDVDLFDTTAEVVAEYKSRGKNVVCYFSAGTFELDRPDGSEFDPACYCDKGDSCAVDGWDEWWFDIHSASCKTSVRTVMAARIALAATKGCDAVDPDNVDSWTNDNGFGNTEADQLDYNMWLSNTSHAANLGVGLKNSDDLLDDYTDEITAAFDFVVIEQCDQYKECNTYRSFVDAGKLAVDIEYDVTPVCKSGFFTMKYSGEDLVYTAVTSTCPTYAEVAALITSTNTTSGTTTTTDTSYMSSASSSKLSATTSIPSTSTHEATTTVATSTVLSSSSMATSLPSGSISRAATAETSAVVTYSSSSAPATATTSRTIIATSSVAKSSTSTKSISASKSTSTTSRTWRNHPHWGHRAAGGQ